MVKTRVIFSLLAVVATLALSAPALAQSFSLAGAGTLKVGDTVSFTGTGGWTGTDFVYGAGNSEIQFLSALDAVTFTVALELGDILAPSVAGGNISGSVAVPVLSGVAGANSVKLRLRLSTNGPIGPVVSANSRDVNATIPSAQTVSISNGATIGGSAVLALTDSGDQDNDITSGLVVQIDFNNAGTWNTLPNQSITSAWAAGAGGTITVDFAAIDANNDGFIEEVLDPGVTNGNVRLRIRVTDVAGNELILGPFTGLTVDTEPPTVLSARTVTTTTIRVVFSETVAGGATTLTNYNVTLGGGQPVGAALTNDGIGTNNAVILTLGGPLAADATPTVTVNNVRDLANNVLSPNPTNVIATDGVAPVLQRALLDTYNGQNLIYLVFNEPIATAGGTKPVGADFTTPGSNISAIGAMTRIDGANIFNFTPQHAFFFSQAALVGGDQLAAGESIAPGVNANQIEDIAGNDATTAAVTVVAIPSLVSSTYDASANILTLTFSKTMSEATLLAGIAAGHVTLSRDDVTGQVALDLTAGTGNAELVSGGAATVYTFRIRSALDRTLFTYSVPGGGAGIAIQIASGIIEDNTGEDLRPAEASDINVGYSADGTAPTIDATYPRQVKAVAVNGNTVDVRFSDYILAPANIAHYTIAGNATVSATIQADGKTVRVVFTNPVDVDVNDGSAVAAVMDVSGAITNNSNMAFAGGVGLAISTDANATSSVAIGAALASNTLVAAAVHAAAQPVFTFNVTDAGPDTLPTNFDEVSFEFVPGVSPFLADAAGIVWSISGGGLGAPITGTATSIGGGVYRLRFQGLARSVTEATTSADFTISVLIPASVGVADNATFFIRRGVQDGYIVSTGGSTFIPTVNFDGPTITYAVQATRLVFREADGAVVASQPTHAFTTVKNVNIDFASWQVRFEDANGMVDTDGNGQAVNVTVGTPNGTSFAGTLASGATANGDAAGIATFTGGTAIRFSTPSREINLTFSSAFAPTGAAVTSASTTGVFNVVPSSGATMATNTAAASIADSGNPENFWLIDISDVGANTDGLPLSLTELRFAVALGGTATTLTISDFVWSLDVTGTTGGTDDGTFASASATAGVVTFTRGGGWNWANNTAGTVHLRVSTGTLMNRTDLDGVTFTASLASSFTAATYAFTGDLTHAQNSSIVTTGINSGAVPVAVVATVLREVATPPVPAAFATVGTPFAVSVEYVNAKNNRDLNVAGDVVTAVRSDAGAVSGGGTAVAASGLASFSITLGAPGNITNLLALQYSDDAANLNLSGNPALNSSTFLLRATDDANSTITENSSPTVAIPSTGPAAAVWVLDLNDLGTSDGKQTIVTNLVFQAAITSTGSAIEVNDFTWTLTNNGPTFTVASTGVAVNGPNTITFSALDIRTATGDAASTTQITLSVVPKTLAGATKRAALDGATMTLQLNTAATDASGTSLDTAPPPVTGDLIRGIGTLTVNVTADRLSFNPTADNSVSNPIDAGTNVTLRVWYTDANGNLDIDVNDPTVTGNYEIVAARQDAGQFFPAPGTGTTVTLGPSAGIAVFTLAMAGPAVPAPNVTTIDFTSQGTLGTGLVAGQTGAAATPLRTNNFSLNALQETTVVAGPGPVAASVGSTAGAPVLVRDFTLADAGNDDINTVIKSLTVSAAASTIASGNINQALQDGTWTIPAFGGLSGTVTGVVAGTSITFDFSGLNHVTINDGANVTGQIMFQPAAAKFNANGLRDGDVLRVSLVESSFAIFDTPVATGGRMAADDPAVTNAGLTVNVIATTMRWITDTAKLPVEVREGEIVLDTDGLPLAIEYTDANGNRDLNATDSLEFFWTGVADGRQGTVTRPDNAVASNAIALTAGTVTLTNFRIFNHDAGANVGMLNGNIYVLDAAGGVLNGTATYAGGAVGGVPVLNAANNEANANYMRLAFGGANGFNVRAINDADSTFANASPGAPTVIPVGGASVQLFAVTFTDTGFSDGHATVIDELRFDVQIPAVSAVLASHLAWTVQATGGTPAYSSPAIADLGGGNFRVQFTGGALFSVADGGTLTVELWAQANGITGNPTADNQTVTVGLAPGAGLGGGNGVVPAATNSTSILPAQATVNDPQVDTLSVTATTLVFISYDGGGGPSSIVDDHRLGIEGGVFRVEFQDADGNRDLDPNGAPSAITATADPVGAVFTPTTGSFNPTNGVVTFELTFTTTRLSDLVTSGTNEFHLDFAQGVLTGDSTGNFNVHSDGNSTLTTQTVHATIVDGSTPTYQPVWSLTVTDVGTADGLPTILDSLTLTASLSNGYAIDALEWELFNGVTTFPVSVDTGAGTLTIAPGGGNIITVANADTGTLVLRARAAAGLVDNVGGAQFVDGTTIDVNVTAANAVVFDATNSSTFRQPSGGAPVDAFAPFGTANGTTINVVADQITVSNVVGAAYPGDGDTPGVPVVPMGEERVGIDFDVVVFYQNGRGNRDLGVNGDVASVQRFRTDTGLPDGQTVTQGNSAPAVNGVANFTGANAVRLGNAADVTNFLFLRISDDAGNSIAGAGITPGDTPNFILRTFDDANSTITENGTQPGNVLNVMTTGTNSFVDLWNLDLTDLETSDPVPTIIVQLVFTVGIANAGGNDIADLVWELWNGTSSFVGAVNVGAGTVTFNGTNLNPLVQAGDADLNTNGTPDVRPLTLRARVKTETVDGAGNGVKDPANIDETQLTISLSAPAMAPTIYDDGMNDPDSTSLNPALAPVSAPLTRTAGIVTIDVVATKLRELPTALVTGTNRTSTAAFNFTVEFADVNNYRDLGVDTDVVTVLREDAQTGSINPAKGPGVIISGATANATNGLAAFTTHLGYPGFAATSPGHRLFFRDNAAGNIDLETPNPALDSFTTGAFTLEGVSEATIAAGLGSEASSVSSVAAGPAAVVDFQIIDNGTDNLSTDITQITINVGGTAQPGEGLWFLDGPDLIGFGDFTLPGSVPSFSVANLCLGVVTGNTVQFGNNASLSGNQAGMLPIRVGDNTGTIPGLQSETYRVLFIPFQNAVLTTQDNQAWTVTVNSANFIFDTEAGSRRNPSVNVDNSGVGGLRYDVVATSLNFGASGSAPAGSLNVAGASFVTQPNFTATDSVGNRDLDYNNTVTATITNNAGGAGTVLSGTNPRSFTAGAASFTNLSINKAGTGYEITYSSGSLPPLVTSPAFDVIPAAAMQVEVTAQPTNTTAGSLMSPGPTVRLLDSFGNVTTAPVGGVNVTVTIITPPGGIGTFDDNSTGSPATFGNSLANVVATVPAGQSTVTFPNLRINRAATGYALRFTAASLGGGAQIDSSTFNVTPGAPASISMASSFTDPHSGNISLPGIQPAGATAGANFGSQPVLVLLDPLGNVRTGDSTTVVTATIVTDATYPGITVDDFTNGQPVNNNNTTGVLQGLNSQQVTAVNGVVSFAGSGLRIDRAGVGYVLQFSPSDVNYGTVNSNALTVLPATGTTVRIEEQPADATAGANIPGANTSVPVTTIRISIRDSFNNVVTTNNSTVLSAAIGADPSSGSAVLSSPTLGTSKTVAQGVADFNDLRINKAFAGYTLNFSSGGLATATSTAFTVNAAAAASIQITQQPTSLNAGTAFFPNPSVTLLDAFGNVAVNDSTTVVRMTIASNPSTGSLRLTTAIGTTVAQVDATAVNGVATFSNVTLDIAANGYSLQFAGAVTPLPAVTSNLFAVNPGAPNNLQIISQPGNTVAGLAVSPSPQLRVRDQFNNHVTSDNSTQVTAAFGVDASLGQGTLNGTTSQSASGGVVTFNNLSINVAANGYTLAFTSSVTGATSSAFNITPAPAAAIQITAQPGNTDTDGTIPAPAIRLVDAFGNVATNNNSTVVAVQIGTDPSGSATLSGTTSKPVTAGIATFAGLGINRAGNGYTLTFSGTGLSGAGSNTFNVAPGAPAAIVITTQPGSGTAGSAFVQPRVEVRDAKGNLTTNNNTTQVSVIIGTNPSSASFNAGSTTSITVSGGVANWSGLPGANQLRIDAAASGYTLVFSAAGGITPATSNSFNIAHGAASQLALTTQPGSATAGQSFNVQPVIEIRDAFGNRVTSDSTSVVNVAFVLDGPGGTTGNPLGNANGVLQGPPSQPANSGIASFGGLRVDQAGVGYRLRFSAGLLTSVDSNVFNVNHAAPALLVVTTQPAGAFGGAAFTTQPVVEVRDAFGNVATTSSLTVTGSLGADPSGGMSGFTGGPSLAAVNGVVNFGTLPGGNQFRINKAATNYTMTFSASGLPPVQTLGFNVLVGPAASIHMVTQPDGFRATIGGVVQPLDPQPVVELRDLGGNVTTANNTTQVTVSLGVSLPVSGVPTLGGTLTETAASGVISYSNVSISEAGDYTLVFSSGALTPAESAQFTLVAGPVQLQTIALDDHDNNGVVSARDRLLFAWDEEIDPQTVPVVNTNGELDTALGLTATFGTDATAEMRPDGVSIWVRVGTGTTVVAGTTTAKPTTIANNQGFLDTTPNPIVVGGASTDTFAPRLLSLTFNGNANPGFLAVGPVVIEATYTDDQANATISIVAPGTADVNSVAMTAVDPANPRVFRYTYNVLKANGAAYVDGTHQVTVSNATDARGNAAVSDVALPATFVTDTTNPMILSAVVTDPDNFYRNGETVNLLVTTTEIDLTVTVNLAGVINGGGVVTLNNNGDTTYSGSFSGTATADGLRTLTITATDAAGNVSTAPVGIVYDNVAPVTTLSFNAPQTSVPAGPLTISAAFTENLVTRPELNITFATNTELSLTAQPMLGTVPGAGFSYTIDIPSGTTDTVTITVGNAGDRAGNAATQPINNVLTVTGGAAVLTANAGEDVVLTGLRRVTLNGTASVGATSYSWTVIAPAGVTLSGATTATPSFLAQRGGTHVFQLEVGNGSQLATDVVTVTVPNVAPAISGLGAINIAAGEVAGGSAKVGLSAQIIDGNGDELTYAWALTSGPLDGNLAVAQGTGSAMGGGTATANVAITDNENEMVGGVYEFTLSVWDGEALLSGMPTTAIQRFVVVAPDRVAPASHAGLDQTVNLGTVVQLSGNESSDPNASVPQFPALIYSWTLPVRPAGSNASLSGADSVNPTLIPDVAGVYVAELVVTDIESFKSGADTVTITVVEATNVRGVRSQIQVNSTDDDDNGSINVGETVILDGSLSAGSGPISDRTYSWTQIAGPAVVLDDPSAGVQTFIPSAAGQYVFQLIAGDAVAGAGIPATATFSVAPAGSAAPVAMGRVAQSDDIDGDGHVFFVPGRGVDLNLANPSIELTAAGSTGTGTLSYSWRQVAGPTVGIINGRAQVMSFIPLISRVYEFEVTVTDGNNVSSTARVSLAVDTYHPILNPTGNNTPMASATGASGEAVVQTTAGLTVSLLGSASDSNDTDGLIYTWVQLSGPPVVLTGGNSASPSFVATVPGLYRFAFFVDDGFDISLPSTVDVQVGPSVGPQPDPNATGSSGCSVSSGSTSGSLALALAVLAMLALMAGGMRMRRS